MVLAQQGRELEEAAQLIAQVVRETPDSPNLLDTQAYVLMRAGRFDEAAEAARAAMALDPANPDWSRRLNEIQAQRASAAEATP